MKKVEKSKEPEKKKIRKIEIDMSDSSHELTSERPKKGQSWCGTFDVEDEIREDYRRVWGDD